jgi:hypothetical protein
LCLGRQHLWSQGFPAQYQRIGRGHLHGSRPASISRRGKRQARRRVVAKADRRRTSKLRMRSRRMGIRLLARATGATTAPGKADTT